MYSTDCIELTKVKIAHEGILCNTLLHDNGIEPAGPPGATSPTLPLLLRQLTAPKLRRYRSGLKLRCGSAGSTTEQLLATANGLAIRSFVLGSAASFGARVSSIYLFW